MSGGNKKQLSIAMIVTLEKNDWSTWQITFLSNLFRLPNVHLLSPLH